MSAKLRRSVLLALIAAVSSAAGAQGDDQPELRLDDFRLDAPPALTLLGIAGSSVARPNTPRALITSIVSATGSSGLVPNGYAMETAPYWLKRHRALDLKRYFSAPLGERLAYFTAISAATSRPSSRSDTVSPDARVSVAVRTLLVNGRPSAALIATMDSMRAAQLSYIGLFRRAESLRPHAGALEASRRRFADEEALLSTLVTEVLVGGEVALRDSTLHTLARRDIARRVLASTESAVTELARVEKQMAGIEKDLAVLAASFSGRDMEPEGLVIEVAAGTRALFSHGEWARERVDGLGLWVTPMYRLSRQNLELMAVARYLTRVREFDDDDLLDVGGRAGWGLGRATVSGEWVRRSVRRGEGSTSSWTGAFNYPLPAKLELVASFGSDFRRRDGRRPVIATIGVNLGLGAVMITPSGDMHGR